MQSIPALDLAAPLVGRVSAFADGVERFSFAQLVALVGRLDRSRADLAAIRRTAPLCGADALEQSETHLACMWALVEAELERRLEV